MKKKKKNSKKKEIYSPVLQREVSETEIELLLATWHNFKKTRWLFTQFLALHTWKLYWNPVLDLFAKIKSMAPSSQSIIVSNEIISSTYYKKKKKGNEIIASHTGYNIGNEILVLKEPQVH